MNSLRYLVPNGFTGISMLFGLASVVCSGSGQFELAAWMILWGVLLDKLDGASARLLNASSGFGVQFDSFADFVVFGIAPAALFYFRLRSLEPFSDGAGYILLLSVTGAYVIATSARLARFNISEPPGSDIFFFGIPTTLIGAFLASGFLTFVRYDAPEAWLHYAPILLGVSAISMVTNIRLPKLKARKNPAIHWFQIINVAVVYAVTPFKMWPEYLLILATIYLVVGLGWGLLNPLHIREHNDTNDDVEVVG